jgi:hypothetical protein
VIPSWWGVRVATPAPTGVYLQQERMSCQNPQLDSLLVAQLLWKDEALAVLERHQLAKGYRARRVKDIHLHLARSLPAAVLGEEVRKSLKCRERWLGQTRSNPLDVPVHA